MPRERARIRPLRGLKEQGIWIAHRYGAIAKPAKEFYFRYAKMYELLSRDEMA